MYLGNSDLPRIGCALLFLLVIHWIQTKWLVYMKPSNQWESMGLTVFIFLFRYLYQFCCSLKCLIWCVMDLHVYFVIMMSEFAVEKCCYHGYESKLCIQLIVKFKFLTLKWPLTIGYSISTRITVFRSSLNLNEPCE